LITNANKTEILTGENNAASTDAGKAAAATETRAGGVYVHIPYCKSKCGYCAFYSRTDYSSSELYLTALKKEIDSYKTDCPFDTIYIGGGTPSSVRPGYIAEIIGHIKRRFNIAADAEITVEANPDTCSRGFLAEIAAQGVNRLSLGLQTDDGALLRFLGRRHDYARFTACVADASQTGITNISADLMYGLPAQSADAFLRTLAAVCALPLAHISLYPLKVEEGTPFYESGIAVDGDLQADMYGAAVPFLRERGFDRYEVGNFAKTGRESRHNLKYWRLAPYVGLGAAAHSYFNGERYQNPDGISEYLVSGGRVQKTKISKTESAEEYIMLALRTKEGINLDFLKSEFDCDLMNKKPAEIKSLQSRGMVEYDSGNLRLSDGAFYVMNSIILKLL
jgi:oxygen-independent coproporphyrinogen-3 oxidase